MLIPTHFNNNKQTPDYAAAETLFTQRTSKQGKADGKEKSSQNNPSKGKGCPPPDCDPEVEKQVTEIVKEACDTHSRKAMREHSSREVADFGEDSSGHGPV